jgi:hypothetical protein
MTDAPLLAEIRKILFALEWLVKDSMYKDHPEASQNAIDLLKRWEWWDRNP